MAAGTRLAPKDRKTVPPSHQGNKKPAPKTEKKSDTDPSKPVKIRVSKRAAVVLTAVDNSKVAAALSKVKNNINLRRLGIPSLRPRRALTRAIIYKVPGEQSNKKADALAAKLRSGLDSKEVKIARPVKMAELRLSSLDVLTNCQAVAEAMARIEKCGV